MEEIRKRMTHQYEKGQILVIVTVLLIGLFAMAALILDGGNAYLKRRRAQNAADAGALAGGDIHCGGGTPSEVVSKALEYVGLNEAYADAGDVSIIDDRQVGVQTSITIDTFFAHLIGFPQITVEAEAIAACFPVGGTSVLPVAWSCRPPLEGEEEWDSEDCEILYGEGDDLANPNQKYIVMDDYKVDEDIECLDPNEPVPDPLPEYLFDCDIDNDGYNDILRGGERSWLDLDWDSSNAAEMVDWVDGTSEVDLRVHTWLRAAEGSDVSIFHAAKEREGDIVVIPVFNDFCKEGATEVPVGSGNWVLGCPDKVSPDGVNHKGADEPLDEVRGFGGQNLYFHVVSFALFEIECVSNKPSNHCDLKDAAILAELGYDNNDHTIEGHFLRGFIPGHSGDPNDWVDAGAYTIYLVK